MSGKLIFRDKKTKKEHERPANLYVDRWGNVIEHIEDENNDGDMRFREC